MAGGINLDELADVTLIDSNGDEINVNADGSLNVTPTAGSEVQITDGTDTLAINADGSINTSISEASLDTLQNSEETVTTTAAQVLTSPLANRKCVTIQNEGSDDVYVGSSAGVTAANGIKISRRSSATYNFGSGAAIFMVAASGSQSVRFLELGV